jgi:DNA topoisomerase-6 subunit B
MKKEVAADVYLVNTRPPAVYRGNPFQVEVGIAYGSPNGVGLELNLDGHIRKSPKSIERPDAPALEHNAYLLRFANRVPLLYEQNSCAITKAVTQTNWKAYGVKQSKGGMPQAPMAVVVHIVSVWVPFTSEAKEAIASYPEIIKEIKLGLQQCGRQLAAHIRHDAKLKKEFDKRSYIEKYIPFVGEALQEMLALSDREREKLVEKLDDTLHRQRKV